MGIEMGLHAHPLLEVRAPASTGQLQIGFVAQHDRFSFMLAQSAFAVCTPKKEVIRANNRTSGNNFFEKIRFISYNTSNGGICFVCIENLVMLLET